MKKKMKAAAAFTAVVLLLTGATSCKGRTMQNMEPTGDTVEVDIITDQGDTDSIPAVVSVEP